MGCTPDPQMFHNILLSFTNSESYTNLVLYIFSDALMLSNEFETRDPKSGAPLIFTQHLPGKSLGVLALAEGAQAETVTVFLAGNHKFVMRPGTPTVITTDALLFKIEIQGDIVAARQLEGMFARIEVLGSVMECVGTQERLADGQQAKAF